MNDLTPDAPRRPPPRLFRHGGLRLVVLQLLAESPSHGYEIIKALEARTHGQYSPSPGVIYPTLTQLVTQGLAETLPGEGTRRRYGVTAAGRAFLAEQAEAVTTLMSRLQPPCRGRGPRPAIIEEAVDAFRYALRHRLARGSLSPDELEAIRAIIQRATHAIQEI